MNAYGAGDYHRLHERNSGRTRTIDSVTNAGTNDSTASTNLPLLRVDNLHVQPARSAQGTILRGVNLTVNAGEIHAIVGPPSSGKSALGALLMGSPDYRVTGGSVRFRGDDVTDWPVDERAKAGMFLAFQNPAEVPGVSVSQFLRQAVSARRGVDMSVLELRNAAMETMKRLSLDPSFVDRCLNDGFSGSERQRHEIMQMDLLEPDLAILDGTGSDLDTESARAVAQSICRVRTDRDSMGVVLIAQQHQLIDELEPDHVHVLIDGQIVASGGIELNTQLQRSGYEPFLKVEV